MLAWIRQHIFRIAPAPAPVAFWRDAATGEPVLPPVGKFPIKPMSEDEMKQLFPNLTPVGGVFPAMVDPAPAPRPLYDVTRSRHGVGTGGTGQRVNPHLPAGYAERLAGSGRRQEDDRRTRYTSDPSTDLLSPFNPASPFNIESHAAPSPSYDPPACSPPPDSGSSGIDFGSSSGGCSDGGW